MQSMKDVFPQIGDGFFAEAKDSKYHLRLFSEVYELGHRATVYDVQGKTEVWRGDASDYEDGKNKAEEIAGEHLKFQYNAALPKLSWEMNAQLRSKQKSG